MKKIDSKCANKLIHSLNNIGNTITFEFQYKPKITISFFCHGDTENPEIFEVEQQRMLTLFPKYTLGKNL